MFDITFEDEYSKLVRQVIKDLVGDLEYKKVKEVKFHEKVLAKVVEEY